MSTFADNNEIIEMIEHEKDIVSTRILRQWPVRTGGGFAQGFRGSSGGDNTRLANAPEGSCQIHQ